jgi:hypothetical protein
MSQPERLSQDYSQVFAEQSWHSVDAVWWKLSDCFQNTSHSLKDGDEKGPEKPLPYGHGSEALVFVCNELPCPESDGISFFISA